MPWDPVLRRPQFPSGCVLARSAFPLLACNIGLPRPETEDRPTEKGSLRQMQLYFNFFRSFNASFVKNNSSNNLVSTFYLVILLNYTILLFNSWIFKLRYNVLDQYKFFFTNLVIFTSDTHTRQEKSKWINKLFIFLFIKMLVFFSSCLFWYSIVREQNTKCIISAIHDKN